MNLHIDHKDIDELIRGLDNEDKEVRIEAITHLGDIGDELCLKELRVRMKEISAEHYALVVAVGKLKKKLGVK